MFERTLQDLIRGLRAHKASSKAQEDAFLSEAMVEMREELRGKDMALKAEGVLKMCYVGHQILLYDIGQDDVGGGGEVGADEVVDDALPNTTSTWVRFSCGRGDEFA